jgi:hypothetical protein
LDVLAPQGFYDILLFRSDCKETLDAKNALPQNLNFLTSYRNRSAFQAKIVAAKSASQAANHA